MRQSVPYADHYYHGSMDTWISQIIKYPDVWMDISALLDSWIIGNFDFFKVYGYLTSQKYLDIYVSGYPTIQIPHL